MAERRPEPVTRGPTEAVRIFEQPPDSISFYCDFAQILGTENEILLQFYETIPGPPAQGGAIANVRTRLRVTVVVSPAHAANIGGLLLKRVSEHKTPSPEGESRTPPAPS